MNDFVCRKCGSTEYEIKDKPNGTGVAHGLYCVKCGFWHKWLGKEELKQYATKESKDEIIAKLQSENAALRARLEKAVELPCKVGDTIYEVTSAGIYEWEVESIYLRTKIFQANCVNKNDYKMHWNFIKADYCNEFEGKGRVRVNRLEAEARLSELKRYNK